MVPTNVRTPWISSRIVCCASAMTEYSHRATEVGSSIPLATHGESRAFFFVAKSLEELLEGRQKLFFFRHRTGDELAPGADERKGNRAGQEIPEVNHGGRRCRTDGDPARAGLDSHVLELQQLAPDVHGRGKFRGVAADPDARS